MGRGRPRKIFSVEASADLRDVDLTDPSDMDVEPVSHRKALEKAELRQTLVSISDQIAKDTMYFRNVKFTEADTVFPESVDALKRFCTKYYPYADGGPLLVDEPRNDFEKELAYERHKILKEKNVRHVVIEPNFTLEDVLGQI